MAKGNEIIVSAEPGGRFHEGIISGALLPGTIVQIKAATEPVNGRFTWEVYNADADANQRLIAVLLPDQLQGKLATSAYTDGDRCFVYCPLPGEELNVLTTDIDTGTGNERAIGDLLIVDDGTGKLIATTGSPESEPFICMETYNDPTSTATDYLLHVMFTGY